MPTVEITIGRLREPQKRQIAKGVAHALIDAGIPQASIRIIFRHIDAHDVANGDGTFPYWPQHADSPEATGQAPNLIAQTDSQTTQP